MTLFDRLKYKLHTADKKKNTNVSMEHREESSEEPARSVYEDPMHYTENEKQKLVGMLTPREADLFRLLLEGYTLKESAKELSVKYSTANTHMTAIYKKLRVNSRAELIIKYGDIGKSLS